MMRSKIGVRHCDMCEGKEEEEAKVQERVAFQGQTKNEMPRRSQSVAVAVKSR